MPPPPVARPLNPITRIYFLTVLNADMNARDTERALPQYALSERTRFPFPSLISLPMREAISTLSLSLSPARARAVARVSLSRPPLSASRAPTLSPARTVVRVLTLRRSYSRSYRARALSSRVPFSTLYTLSRPCLRVYRSPGDCARALSLPSHSLSTRSSRCYRASCRERSPGLFSCVCVYVCGDRVRAPCRRLPHRQRDHQQARSRPRSVYRSTL